MLGVPIEGPTNVLCDNKSVVTNSTEPSSVLKKKHNSICYHRVREAVAAQVIRIAHIPTGQNWLICSQSHWVDVNYMNFARRFFIKWNEN